MLGALDLGIVAELDFARWVGLTVSPSLVVPVARPRLGYEDAAGAKQTFFEASAVGASVSLGVMVGAR